MSDFAHRPTSRLFALSLAALFLLAATAWAGPHLAPAPANTLAAEQAPRAEIADLEQRISAPGLCTEPTTLSAADTLLLGASYSECQTHSDCQEICTAQGFIAGFCASNGSGGGVCFCY